MSKFNSIIQNNNSDLQEILNTINTLPEADSGGIELPTLSNQATASEVLINKQLINQDGNIVIGTMPNNGSISHTMDGINTTVVSIPKGYTSGGYVYLDNTIENEAATQATIIADILQTAHNLPNSNGSQSSGAGNNDVCTVTIQCPEYYSNDCVILFAIGTIIEDGVTKSYCYGRGDETYNGGDSITIQNLKCGSDLYFIAYMYYSSPVTFDTEGSAVLKEYITGRMPIRENITYTMFHVIAPTVANEVSTIFFCYEP